MKNGAGDINFHKGGVVEKMKTSKCHRIMPALIFVVLLTGCSWSKGDIMWGVASTVATAADGYTTIRFLNNPDNYEMNPGLGRHPSDEQVILMLATTQGISLALAHFFPKLRPWLLGGKTIVNTSFAIHNYQLDWDKE